MDSELHFGASTRIYIIRERPNPLYNNSFGASSDGTLSNSDVLIGPENRDDASGGGQGGGQSANSLGLLYSQLPQSEMELDNLTEFNTAHNRRIASLVDVSANTASLNFAKLGKRSKHSVHFSEADEVINPEDVDPSVGRFRNLVQETFIPNKRTKGGHDGAFLGVAAPDSTESHPARSMIAASGMASNGSSSSTPTPSLMSGNSLFGPTYSLAAKFGLPLPNLAPDIESDFTAPSLPPTLAILHAHAHSRPGMLNTALTEGGKPTARLVASDILGEDMMGPNITTGVLNTGLVDSDAPKRKKYAKEAWPGKRPGFLVGPNLA